MQKDVDTLWHSILGEAQVVLSTARYSAFWSKLKLVYYDQEEAIFEVISVFAKAQFEKKEHVYLRELLEKNGITSKNLKFNIQSSSDKPKISRETTADTYNTGIDALSSPMFNNQMNSSPSPYATSSSHAPSLQKSNLTKSGLNPRYTFDNFIVGSSNDLAYAASQGVASNPGTKYNPLYFYGGVGLGKTHLMQAVGNEIVRSNPGAKVIYVSMETFGNEFLEYIRFKKKGFSEKYRNADVLIIDDMQFISGKEKTQEEFFHTFNFLHQNNKQIIISSDKPPRSIPTLTERLRSRFEMGMAIDIQMPDFETRCAIITSKASMSGIELDQDVVEFLATNIKTNVRELEGLLNQLLAQADLNGIEPDLSMAEGVIGNIRHTRTRHISSKKILDSTAKHFQIKIDELCGIKRDKHIVVPRQVAMYLLRTELKMSFPKIANELGRKDHTTAIHSVEKIEKAMKLDVILREQIEDLKAKLYA